MVVQCERDAVRVATEAMMMIMIYLKSLLITKMTSDVDKMSADVRVSYISRNQNHH